MDLVFLSKYPFLDDAKVFLKEKNLSLANLPESALKRSSIMISNAFSGKEYLVDIPAQMFEELGDEVIAFTASKIIISAMSQQAILDKFCQMVQKSVFKRLVANKDETINLADSLSANYSFVDENELDKSLFVKVPLLDYISINFFSSESALINMRVQNGNVFMTANDFARYVSELSAHKVRIALPIEKEFIPKNFFELAKSFESQLGAIESREFAQRLSGAIEINNFPPCMKSMYTRQMEGKKLSYIERLALGSFLYQIGMSRNEVSLVFSKSPDYQKNIADYHIARIFEKKLSAPGCKKLFEYGIRVPECEKECTFNHPLQHYIFKQKRTLRQKQFTAQQNQVLRDGDEIQNVQQTKSVQKNSNQDNNQNIAGVNS
jgi:DNA primase large subunit